MFSHTHFYHVKNAVLSISSKDKCHCGYTTVAVSKLLDIIANYEIMGHNCTELSYSRCREVFNEALKAIGYDVKDYGLHSLRSGGISSVVHNSDNTVPERLLKLHGRWKTDTAKDMYVQESVNKRLEVTSFLETSLLEVTAFKQSNCI